MEFLDIIVLLGVVVYGIYTGLSSASKASESLEQYFLAGRSIKGWQAGLSLAAAQFAADTPLLVTGLIAVGGIFAVWRLSIYAVSFLLIGFLFSACWRRANILTDAELVEKRYHGGAAAFLRAFKAIYLGTVFNLVVLAMVLLAASRIVEPFLFWNQWLPGWLFNPVLGMVTAIGVPITMSLGPEQWIHTANNMLSFGVIGVLIMFYSTSGGLRSVIKMDVMQFFVMMLGTACFAWFALEHVGGFQGLYDKLGAIFTETTPMTRDQLLAFIPSQAKDTSLALLLVLALQWVAQINADGSGYMAQRFMACRSPKDGRQAAIVFSFAQILLRGLLWLPIALGLLVIFPPDFSLSPEHYVATREATYVQGMSTLLPPGVRGLILTAMLAALASTVDTHLNWGASYWTNDLYKRFICQGLLKKEPNKRTLVWVARASNVTILCLAFYVMTKLSSIKTAWEASLLLGAGTGIPLILRWVWWRFNAWGEIAALGASLITVPLLFIYMPGGNLDSIRLLTVVVVSTVASIAATYIAGPEPMPLLKSFFKLTRPPGFWGPVISQDADPKHQLERSQRTELVLWRGLFLTAVTAVSLFSLLIGIGSLLFNSPPPKSFPFPMIWDWGLIVLGLLLAAVWSKHAFMLRNGKQAS